MPMSAPGIASTACRRWVSDSPGMWKPLIASPNRNEPSSAPMNAPTIPPQKRSGSQMVKCHRASPIMTQASAATSGSSRGERSRPSLAVPSVSAVARPSLLGPLLAAGSHDPRLAPPGHGCLGGGVDLVGGLVAFGLGFGLRLALGFGGALRFRRPVALGGQVGHELVELLPRDLGRLVGRGHAVAPQPPALLA